jgi:hypothetical protein
MGTFSVRLQRVGLAGVRPDIEVHQALSPRPLDKRTAQCCHAIGDAVRYGWLEFKDQVLSLRALLLDRLINIPAAFLQPEIDARRRLLDDNPKLEFTGHTVKSTRKRPPYASRLCDG